MIGTLQRPLPDDTQRSQETDIHAPGKIRTRNPSASEQRQTDALDRAASGIGTSVYYSGEIDGFAKWYTVSKIIVASIIAGFGNNFWQQWYSICNILGIISINLDSLRAKYKISSMCIIELLGQTLWYSELVELLALQKRKLSWIIFKD